MPGPAAPDPLLDRARALHARRPVVELHADVPLDTWPRRRAGEAAPLADDWLGRWREGGVDVSVVTCGGDMPVSCDALGRPDLRAREMIADVLAEAEACPDLRVVRTAHDLDDALGERQLGLVLHLEGARPLRGRLDLLHELHRLGLRSLGLTWNSRNEAADGVGVGDPHGLTPFGRDLVRQLGRLGMLVDVSHLAEPGFWDVAELVDGPFVASHSNADAVHVHARNVTDEQARAVAASGGLVGVCFFPLFIGEPPTLERLLDHVDHLVELIGIEHLAVGPDYAEGVVGPFLSDMAGDPLYGGAAAGGGAAALPAWATYPEGLRDVRTLPAFTAGLLRRGYSEDEAAALLGGNALRVLRRVLPA